MGPAAQVEKLGLPLATMEFAEDGPGFIVKTGVTAKYAVPAALAASNEVKFAAVFSQSRTWNVAGTGVAAAPPG